MTRAAPYALAVLLLAGCGTSHSSRDEPATVARTLAAADSADPAAYMAALTSLGRRCKQPLHKVADDVESAWRVLSAFGAPETRLAILQGVDKVTAVNASDSRQDCEAVTKGLVKLVEAGRTP